MSELNHDAARQALQNQLGIIVTHIESTWEPCEWSQTFRIMDSQDKVYFLKGTPRTRPEAFVTQLLHEQDAVVPAVLMTDLLPDHEWRWFLMPDMGTTDFNMLLLENALSTAYHLGRLQRRVIHEQRLPALMPQCLPARYLDILRGLSLWMETQFPNTSPEIVDIARTILPARSHFFDEVAAIFSSLPPTCVHGDLWSGNITVRDGEIGLLDWGDTVWGIGTSSVVNFLFSLDGGFPAQDIWDAYARGWQQPITEDIIQASQVAYTVTSLVIEQELARLTPEQTKIPVGILPLLEDLVRLSD